MITEQRELSRAGASEKAAFMVLSVKPPDVTNLHSRSSATRAGRKYLVFTDLFQVADRDRPPAPPPPAVPVGERRVLEELEGTSVAETQTPSGVGEKAVGRAGRGLVLRNFCPRKSNEKPPR